MYFIMQNSRRLKEAFDLITGLLESASAVSVVIGDVAHSLIACDLPVVGGPKKIE